MTELLFRSSGISSNFPHAGQSTSNDSGIKLSSKPVVSKKAIADPFPIYSAMPVACSQIIEGAGKNGKDGFVKT